MNCVLSIKAGFVPEGDGMSANGMSTKHSAFSFQPDVKLMTAAELLGKGQRSRVLELLID